MTRQCIYVLILIIVFISLCFSIIFKILYSLSDNFIVINNIFDQNNASNPINLFCRLDELEKICNFLLLLTTNLILSQK